MSSNITIQAPARLAKESWFLKAIEDAPDYLYNPPYGDMTATDLAVS